MEITVFCKNHFLVCVFSVLARDITVGRGLVFQSHNGDIR